MATRRYTKQFKLKAVKESLKPEYTDMEFAVAEKFGIKEGTLLRWKDRYLEYGEDGLAANFRLMQKTENRTTRQELAEKEKRIRELEEENEILKSRGLSSKDGPRLKFAFMYRYRYEHAITRMAKVLEVSVSGYYKWLKRQSNITLRDIENIEIERKILEIYHESKAIFGIRKITAELNKISSKRINHKRFERIMREKGIYSRTKKKFIATTDSSQTNKPAPNLLNRDFTSDKPRKKLISDTTYVQTVEGTLYVAVILDLYARMPLGLSMSTKNDRNLVINCFEDMLCLYELEEGCIIHSDQGSTYASEDYQNLLKKHKLRCSMSRKADCWDNAAMESFFGKLKTEWLYRKPKTIKEAKQRIYNYVWNFYAKKRPHASNNYLTPFEVYHEQVN